MFENLRSTLGRDGASPPDRDQLLKIASHAEDDMLALTDGLEGIGYLLWHGATNCEEAIEPDYIAKVGHLVQVLAVQVRFLHGQYSDAKHLLARADKAGTEVTP